MDANTTYSPADQFADTLHWWRGAGVDWCFADTPHDWLAVPDEENTLPAAVQKQPTNTPASAQATGRQNPAHVSAPSCPMPDPATWPQELEQFSSWWLNEPLLDTGGPCLRIAPRIRDAGAELAVIVPAPEEEDRDHLLSGPQGRLLGGMLAAMGLGDGQVHVASALPQHTSHPDWTGPHAALMGAVLRHHLGLAKPRRVLVFGAAILPLIGHDPAQSPATFQQITLEGGNVPALAALDLKTLLERPRLRARFWHRWLEWTNGTP